MTFLPRPPAWRPPAHSHRPAPSVQPGEFVFAAAHMDHGHLTGMCHALSEAGATSKRVYELDERKRDTLLRRHPPWPADLTRASP